MDNLLQLAMQIIFCLLIAALLGAIIGYLLGKMSKCEGDDYEYHHDAPNRELNSYDKDTEVHNTSSNRAKTLAATAAAATTVASVAGTRVEEEVHQADATLHTSQQNIYAKTVDHSASHAIGQEIGIKPQAFDYPLNGEADDLKEISGIGIKIEETLNSLGIYNFEQISNWSADNVEWIENYLTLKDRVSKEDWIGQAKLLAAGGQTDFSKKVRRGENKNYR